MNGVMSFVFVFIYTIIFSFYIKWRRKLKIKNPHLRSVMVLFISHAVFLSFSTNDTQTHSFILVLTHCRGRNWVITNSNRCSLMFHGNRLTFRYFSRRMSLRSVWQNSLSGRLFSGSQINLCNSICSNGLAYWFSGDWAMVTIPVLMLRGHAINMWWKTQLHFPRCWNNTTAELWLCTQYQNGIWNGFR